MCVCFYCFFEFWFSWLITARGCVKSLRNRTQRWQLDSEPGGGCISLSGFQKGEGVGIGLRLRQTEREAARGSFTLSLED